MSPQAPAAVPMRTALVTGASGLLGYWVVRALLDRGVTPVVLERAGAAASALRSDGLLARCAVVTGDLLDDAVLHRALTEHGIDSVFHLAAQSITGAALRHPAATYEVNVRGTWLLLEACRGHGVGRTVVASSDRVYGAPGAVSLTERSPLDARLPYDVSKAAADLIARSAWTAGGQPVAVMRTTNLYGGGDRNRSRLVPELMAAILAGRPPTIHTDGSPRRRHLHAADAADAYLAVADALGHADGGGAAGEAFNVGGAELRSVRELAELALEVGGAAVTPDYRGAPVPAAEVDTLDVDTAKLRALTGWTPRTGLREGLEATLAWYRERPEVLGA